MNEKKLKRMLGIVLMVLQSVTMLSTALLAMGTAHLNELQIGLLLVSLLGVGTGGSYMLLKNYFQSNGEGSNELLKSIATDSQNVLLANEVVSMMADASHDQIENAAPKLCKIASIVESQMGKAESCLSHLLQVDQILQVTSEAIIDLSEKTEQINTQDVRLMNDIRGLRGQLMLSKEALMAHERLLTEKISELSEESVELAKTAEETLSMLGAHHECTKELRESFKHIERLSTRLNLALQEGQLV